MLLLGSSGQVGWELRRLLESKVEMPGRERADLARPESLRAVVREHRPNVILNAAAYTAVDAAEKNEALAHVINAESPGVLAEEAARLGALLVHYSTDYVFDGSQQRPWREDDPVAPMSAYGRTKLAGEQAVRASGCRHLILRTSWVYAARGRNFLLTMLKLAGERDELRVVSDQFGAPTWARSLARATVEAIEAVAGGKIGQTYHAAGAGRTSWHGFAERIVAHGAALGLCRAIPVRAIATVDYPTPARRPACSVLSSERLLVDLGIALPPWELALDECLQEMAERSGPTHKP